MLKGWKEYKIKDITIKVGSGSTPKGGKDSYKTSGISLIRSLNVYDFSFSEKNLAFIDSNQAQKLKNVVVKENDILLNITGASVGRCCMVPAHILPARVNQHVSIIRVDKKIVDPRYLLFTINLKSYKDLLLNISETGATREALTKDDILNFKVIFPPLLIQTRIADILSAYDEFAENNQKRIEILKKMAEQLYKEWFVNMRFPGHQNTKFIKGVPEGWEYKNLKQVVKTQYGFTASAEANSEIGPKFLRITDIAQKELKWSEVPYCILPDKDFKKYKLNHGDVVIARTGATVGYAKLIINPPKAVFASYLVRVVPKSKLDIFLIGIAVESNDFKNFIQSVATGAAQPQANAELMSLFTILVPIDEIKVKFNSVVEPCFLETDFLKKQNDNLRQTRDLLLPRLVSGKLSVEKAEKQLESII